MLRENQDGSGPHPLYLVMDRKSDNILKAHPFWKKTPPPHHPNSCTDEGPSDWIIKSLVTLIVSQLFNGRTDQTYGVEILCSCLDTMLCFVLSPSLPRSP